MVLHRPFELTAETGHVSGNPTLQELVDKSFQIKKSCCTSSWH